MQRKKELFYCIHPRICKWLVESEAYDALASSQQIVSADFDY